MGAAPRLHIRAGPHATAQGRCITVVPAVVPDIRAQSDPCIICVAHTGCLPRKAASPAVPLTIPDQTESAQAGVQAGATFAHNHMGDKDRARSSSPKKCAALKAGPERHCPGMVVHLSIGARSDAGQTRGGMRSLRPDMASLSAGSNTCATHVSENPPDLPDWLAAGVMNHRVKPAAGACDLSFLLQAHAMWKKGQMTARPCVHCVMGVKNAMPADREVFDHYIKPLRRLFGADAPACAAGIGPHLVVLNDRAVSSGGHAFTGLKGNLRLATLTLARSGAAHVRRAVGLCDTDHRPFATWQPAPAILRLAQPLALAPS